MQRDRYPENWEEISRSIRERAGWKCEGCGVANGAVGYRDINGRFWSEKDLQRSDGDHPPLRRNMTKIVLTVAHLGAPLPDGSPGDKHDKMDVRPENLQALCQRCHLALDMADHVANAKATRERKKMKGWQQLTVFAEQD